jgi:mono/diheme cytochrome c family protein
MNRVLKGAGYAVAVLVVLFATAAAGIYTASERALHRTYATPVEWAGAWPVEEEDLEEGRRLATLRGCYGGCHGTTVEGSLFFDEPRIARLAAPNLSLAVREYSDAELERVIRRGVRRDGRSVFAMPSPMFSHLADEDYARIVAFLRSQPVVDGDHTEFDLGPVGRIGVALGRFPPLATRVETRSPQKVPREDRLEWGRYLALTVCSECHGPDLRGDPEGGPDLRIAAAYSDEAWFTLMRTGRGLGDRELGLMTSVSLSRFQHLTDDEALALRAYLGTLAD